MRIGFKLYGLVGFPKIRGHFQGPYRDYVRIYGVQCSMGAALLKVHGVRDMERVYICI